MSTAGLFSLAPLGLLARIEPTPHSTIMSTASTLTALLSRLVRANDAVIDRGLAHQRHDPARPLPGAVEDGWGIANAHATARHIAALACAAHAAESRHHTSEAAVTSLVDACGALLALQHADGTIDLVSTNFHSTPDTAFALERITAAARILIALDRPAQAVARGALETFIRRAGEALIVGGVHTPNHRWAVCGALASVHALYPDQRYVDRIDQWLAEGIDLDPDGQYTEKSTGGYSAVVDRALLNTAKLLNRPELLEPVRRNLAMTLYYVHPDGELVTEASKRQDQYKRVTLAKYYMCYRAMALQDGDGRFAAVARRIERTWPDELTGELLTFLEEPEWQAEMVPDAALPEDYARVFAYSHLARVRRGELSYTVLAGNPTLVSLRRGRAALEAVRMAAAFFGKGQFEGGTLEVIEGGFRLRQRLEAPYFQPLPPERIVPGAMVRMAPNGTLAADGDQARETSEVQLLESVVEVREILGGVALDFKVGGTDGVPVAIELAFRAGGQLEGVVPVAGVDEAFLLEGAEGTYTDGTEVIRFGPGRAEHRWTQLRGARPKWAGRSVYLTGLTPFHSTLKIT